MQYEMNLPRSLFTPLETEILHSEQWSVTTKTYSSGVASLTIRNSLGYVEVLPFMGQIIWDAEFCGHSLRMENMFSEPKPATLIEDTYGCFAFHSGLLAAGCPGEGDNHPLHGEFACAPMDSAKLIISNNAIRVVSCREYLKGFGDHYVANPSVTLHQNSSMFDIELRVQNMSKYASMPLQYMCHMNYAFVPSGKITQNLPADAFKLRESVPAHVKPTEKWLKLNADIKAGNRDANSLEGAEEFDPEIVYFADGVDKLTEEAILEMTCQDGTVFETRFSTESFPVITRWILHNEDQKVAAFALPGTSRPEGREAARKAGMLIELAPGEARTFQVTTGIKEN